MRCASSVRSSGGTSGSREPQLRSSSNAWLPLGYPANKKQDPAQDEAVLYSSLPILELQMEKLTRSADVVEDAKKQRLGDASGSPDRAV